MPSNTEKIPWKFILKLFIGLRVTTFIAAIIGLKLLDFKPSFPYSETFLEKFGHPLFWSWANFDGVHYLMLAREGYVFGLTQAFFPGYLLLIRLVSLVLQNYLLSGLFISHLFFILSLAIFYKLLRLDYSKIISRKILVFLTFFPTSFYFLSVYNESLFLFLLLFCFYCLRTFNYNKIGIAGIFLTLTRIVGIFVIPAFFVEAWEKIKAKNLKTIFYLTLPSLGLFLYMWYLNSKFNDPLMFAHVQEGFGSGRSTGKLVLLYQVFWRYLKMIITVDRQNPIYFTVWLELISSLSFIALLIWGYVKKIRLSYIVFSALAFLLPTLTGTLSSMPRYVLVLFPGFIALGLIKQKSLQNFILGFNFILLIICTALFTRGYWIA
jgi:hypothetical protein